MDLHVGAGYHSIHVAGDDGVAGAGFGGVVVGQFDLWEIWGMLFVAGVVDALRGDALGGLAREDTRVDRSILCEH